MLSDVAKDLNISRGYAIGATLNSLIVLGEGSHANIYQPVSASAALVFGCLIIQLPSEYASDDSGSAWYEGERVSLEFSPDRYGLQFIGSYAGIRHQFGPVRSGMQILLIYDLTARLDIGFIDSPKMAPNFTDLMLHPRHGSVAPVTTDLLSLLGYWLDAPDEPTHLIYAAGYGPLGPDCASELELINEALEHANYWAGLLAEQTHRALISVQLPTDVSHLIVAYISSDVQKGFFWYETEATAAASQRGGGWYEVKGSSSQRVEDLRFVEADEQSDLPFHPASIQLSSTFRECLNAIAFGRTSKTTGPIPWPVPRTVIVIMPAARIVHMMAKNSLRSLFHRIATVGERDGRVPNLLMQLFRVDLTWEEWLVMLDHLPPILTNEYIITALKRAELIMHFLQNITFPKRLDIPKVIEFLFAVLRVCSLILSRRLLFVSVLK
jgi:hypothetical protein